MRKSRKARKTDKPNEVCLKCDQTISNNEPNITMQSKRLNDDSKYFEGPSAYILRHISDINSPRKMYSVYPVRQKKKNTQFLIIGQISAMHACSAKKSALRNFDLKKNTYTKNPLGIAVDHNALQRQSRN